MLIKRVLYHFLLVKLIEIKTVHSTPFNLHPKYLVQLLIIRSLHNTIKSPAKIQRATDAIKAFTT